VERPIGGDAAIAGAGQLTETFMLAFVATYVIPAVAAIDAAKTAAAATLAFRVSITGLNIVDSRKSGLA
jgi:hypothetical protein